MSSQQWVQSTKLLAIAGIVLGYVSYGTDKLGWGETDQDETGAEGRLIFCAFSDDRISFMLFAPTCPTTEPTSCDESRCSL